jgi:hypothetical protein
MLGTHYPVIPANAHREVKQTDTERVSFNKAFRSTFHISQHLMILPSEYYDEMGARPVFFFDKSVVPNESICYTTNLACSSYLITVDKDIPG